MESTIKLSTRTKELLSELKVHRREPYEDVILDLLKNAGKNVTSKNIPTLFSVRTVVIPILKNYGIKRAAIFGSIARGDANEKSDVDILIERPEDPLLVLPLIVDLKKGLGREVDLVTYEALDEHIKDNVYNESVRII